jgi:hypothetical protein
VRGVKVRAHHKQRVCRGVSIGSKFATTDQLLKFVAGTVWLAGISAVFTAPDIDHSTGLLRISEMLSTSQ